MLLVYTDVHAMHEPIKPAFTLAPDRGSSAMQAVPSCALNSVGLPIDSHCIRDNNTFKKKLKTFLFCTTSHRHIVFVSLTVLYIN